MHETAIEKIPGKSHYSLRYLQNGRVFSYAHQLHAAIGFGPETVLEVGGGGGVVAAALRAAGIRATVADIQPQLRPGTVANVTDLPFRTGAFDVALCCQVLEHLPFERFSDSVSELWRVCGMGLILSLPDATPHYEIRLRLPRLPQYAWTGSRMREPGKDWKTKKWDSDGHYWEIGYRATSLEGVNAALRTVTGTAVETWRVPEKPYHRFFRLRKP